MSSNYFKLYAVKILSFEIGSIGRKWEDLRKVKRLLFPLGKLAHCLAFYNRSMFFFLRMSSTNIIEDSSRVMSA